MEKRVLQSVLIVFLFTARQLETLSAGNETYQTLRINSWNASQRYALRSISSLVDVDRRLDSDQSSMRYRSLLPTDIEQSRRQVDPLHSCIEAKCSSWNSGHYLDCIYRHCISGFQLHGHRRESDDTSTADTFGPPEGRFLLLPVAVDSTNTPQLPDVLRPEAPSRRMLLKAGTDAFSRLSAGQHQENNVETRLKRHINDGKHAENRLQSKINRRYYDIEGDCVKKMCGHLAPHTLYHLQCKEEQCTGKV